MQFMYYQGKQIWILNNRFSGLMMRFKPLTILNHAVPV